MKGLEALRELRENGAVSFSKSTISFTYLAFTKRAGIIEKELKALEIIKRLPTDYIKNLFNFIRDEWFKNEDFDAFISWGGDETPILINKEEYDLLKEVLYGKETS